MSFVNGGKITVLIVDNSRDFCKLLESHLSKMPNISVVGTACDAYEARDKILDLSPDIMTLDTELPRMNGIRFLQKLIPQYPIPVIVVSSKSSYEEAMDAGAYDYMEKPAPSDPIDAFSAKLAAKIYICVSMAISRRTPNNTAPLAPPPHPDLNRKVIALGASTGGTDALETVLMGIPADCPPIVVVQHMPPGFTKMFADRLNNRCKMEVREAVDGDRLHNGLCLVAAGDKHLRLMHDSMGYYASCAVGEKVSGHCPSVDVLFTSVAESAGSNAVAAILTGMGSDGAKGMKLMRDKGAYTIGQDKETCVVYGMPMVAFKLGGVCEQAPLSGISAAIMRRI
ncbi:MAG: chemotaxis response regulator protein-glutamate methylesterase [Oscillospiraceae bacterium]|nr:chemotaxis response regulator protein-glutamate methylesterase [Oscillospiraceae bacterium]